ncbi:MAG: DUF975 family protein [Christensenellales bacterium]|jgi:uncharacterized membrane protein
MRLRMDIKAQAKQALASQRGTAILLYIVVGVIFAAAAGLTFGAATLLLMPLYIGLAQGFLQIWKAQKTEVSVLFSPFKNYGRSLGGILWMELWIAIWSLLFVIPGIVKSIAYSFTPYILAEYPAVSSTDALKLSMRITDGHKGAIFVFYLSYIGWGMLSALTFGILEIVYVAPYRSIAFAGMYEDMKNYALANGVITEDQLNGAML